MNQKNLEEIYDQKFINKLYYITSNKITDKTRDGGKIAS